MNSPRALFAAAAALVALAGCDVPTEPPIIQQRWIIPVDETALSVDELLPEGLTVTGTAFDVTVDDVYAFESLGNLCPACAPLQGQTAPVPAFTGDFASTQSLPADLLSGVVASGSMDVLISNQFAFDPLFNGGSIVITLRDQGTGRTLGELLLEDPTDELPAFGTVTRTVPIAPGAISGPLEALIAVDAPGGQNAFIDVTVLVEVTATTQSLLVSEATVDVGTRSVTLDEQVLDLDLDSDITDRILGGTLVLEVDNPFAIDLDGSLVIGATSKPFSIDGAGPSTVSIPYTAAELRSFLGQTGVVLTGSGTAAGNAVTLGSGQRMDIKAKLDFTLEIG